jgi:hypothetical protein
MRVGAWLCTATGLAKASGLLPRENTALPTTTPSTWRPKTQDPSFFSLRVDDKCSEGEEASACPFAGYAIRLQGGSAIATPYNKWWDPKLPMFFVDDDTQCYTVSFSAIVGAFRSDAGWLTSFTGQQEASATLRQRRRRRFALFSPWLVACQLGRHQLL